MPSFDEYVAFGYAATWLLERSPEFRNLYRQSTMLGLDALGNMLYLSRRKVAFAPDTPVVRELVDHLNKSHAFFGQHFGGIYATEDAAVRELNVGRRENLWGIVAVRDDGDDGEDGAAKPAPARTASPTPFACGSRSSRTPSSRTTGSRGRRSPTCGTTPAGSSRCSTRSTTRCFESRAGLRRGT